jgi:hypothetical protein
MNTIKITPYREYIGCALYWGFYASSGDDDVAPPIEDPPLPAGIPEWRDLDAIAREPWCVLAEALYRLVQIGHSHGLPGKPRTRYCDAVQRALAVHKWASTPIFNPSADVSMDTPCP